MKSLASITDSIIEKSNLNPTIRNIFEHWDLIVGSEVAQNITPCKFVRISGSDILIVKAKNLCAIEIQHDSFQIIEKLNQYFGTKVCSAVRVIKE